MGVERYQETYREYENGERFMQQQGNLNAFNGSIKYHFNEKDAIKIEGRYAKGKVDYTGGENPSSENPEGTPYGSVHQKVHLVALMIFVHYMFMKNRFAPMSALLVSLAWDTVFYKI